MSKRPHNRPITIGDRGHFQGVEVSLSAGTRKRRRQSKTSPAGTLYGQPIKSIATSKLEKALTRPELTTKETRRVKAELKRRAK